MVVQLVEHRAPMRKVMTPGLNITEQTQEKVLPL